MRFQEIADHGIRVDGALRDWRRIRKISVGAGDDASMQFALGYDRGGLYVAAAVRDQRMIRSRRPTRDEDAIVVTLALPTRPGRRTYQATEVWIFAGVEGRTAGSAAVGGTRGRLRPARGARVVEAAGSGGYEIEAYIPWAAIPRSAGWEQGRVSVRLRDIDSEARPEVHAEPATAPVDTANLDRLPAIIPSGGDHAVLANFLQRQGIPGQEPRHDLRGNVCGDDRPERIVHVGRFLLVMGDGYRDGDGYDFLALPIQGPQDVMAAELRDFTADGKKELFLRVRQHGERGTRDLWSLYSFTCTAIRPLFAIEQRKALAGGHVESRIRVRGGRGAPRIEVAAGSATGIAPEDWNEAPATDAEAILLPWGPVLARTYRWDGQRFATSNERANPNPHVRGATRTTTTTRTPATTQAEAPPPTRTVRDLIRAVRTERRIPRSVQARFVQDANLAGSPATERLVVFGKAVVVVGENFREGQGYFHYELAVQNAEDLLDVKTEDVTGDGRAEVLVRVRQTLGDVTRELLMVHRFARGGTFPRVLTVEVGRTRGNERIANEVRTVRGTLEIRPGRTQGWTADNWPWSDSPPGDVAPLLLPWRDQPVRYRLQGARLTPR